MLFLYTRCVNYKLSHTVRKNSGHRGPSETFSITIRLNSNIQLPRRIESRAFDTSLSEKDTWAVCYDNEKVPSLFATKSAEACIPMDYLSCCILPHRFPGILRCSPKSSC